jgi:xanthine dehydrogenase accessory factor
MKNIYVNLFERLKRKEPLVLATIIETRGSTPQVPGASAIFSSEGLLKGTLGGGLLEAEAQKEALLALRGRKCLLFEFDLLADISSEEGAICGGEVKILIDARPDEHKDTFHKLNQSLIHRQPGVLSTCINRFSEGKASLLRYWIEGSQKFEAGEEKNLSLFREDISKALSEEKPGLLKLKEKIFPGQAEESFVFLEPILPLQQLVIAGAGHIGQALSHLGNLLDFEVTVIDDRPEFANKERLPDADNIIVDEVEKAVRNFPISPDTYLVIVTRGHHHDAEALRPCISSKAAYVGMIGSTRKIKLMREKFIEQGWATPEEFEHVHAPIGIDIQSKTVEEIAVSIAAQLVLVRSQIKDRKGKIR